MDKSLNIVFKACEKDDIKSINLYLRKGGNPDIQDYNGFTLLMDASILGYTDIVKLLLEGVDGQSGADLNIQNKEGKTALDYAIKYNQIDIIKLLTNENKTTFKRFFNNLEEEDWRLFYFFYTGVKIGFLSLNYILNKE